VQRASHGPELTSPSPKPGLLQAATRRVLVPVIAAKLVTLLLLAWAALDHPAQFNHAGYIAIYRGNHGAPPAAAPGADVVFRTWDAEHYLTLAERGYGGRGPENAFYPLYPALVRACSPLLGGNLLASAVLLSTVLGIVALLVIHDLLVRRASTRVADVTLLLLCVQPAAFFTVLPYTEALFLLLLGLFFSALSRERFMTAAAIGGLLALTRPVGIFSIAPLALALLQERRPLREWLATALPLVGWALYFAVLYFQTGDPLLGFSIQKQFVAAPAMQRLLDPLGFLQALLDVRRLHGFSGSLLDRLAFVGFALGAIALFRRARTRDRDFFALALLLGAVPAVTTVLMSFVRYLSVIFPVFLPLGEALAPKSRRALLAIATVVLLALQLWLLHRHVTYRWAA
jgi:hypothetical protein